MPKPIGLPPHETFWAITEAGLEHYEESMRTARSQIAAGVSGSWDDEEGEQGSELLSVEGSVGVIGIKGPLVNSDSLWNQILGLVSYNSIREALIEAAANPDVKTILLDIDSPGGAVSGVGDCADLISTIDRNVKPVHAFTDGSMASGAYWLGSAARSITASNVATIGSIGVVMNHMERSKMLADMGIKATVIRSGKYKQVGNPNEPLTEEGRAELQAMSDSIYKIFVNHVAENRGKTYDYTDQYMAQGRVFLAENALQVGLVDNIKGFDSTLIALNAVNAVNVDNSLISFQNNGIGATMKNNKKSLVTAVEAALIAAGHIPVKAEAEEAPNQEPQTLEVTVSEEDVAAVVAKAAESCDEDEAPIIESSENNDSNLETLQAELQVLRAQVAERDTQLIDAKVENKSLLKQVEQAEASMEGLKAIAIKSVNAMQVALGGSATSFDASSAADILAAHANVSADFTKNFRVGGVAAVDVNTDDTQKTAAVDSLRAAKLKAV